MSDDRQVHGHCPMGCGRTLILSGRYRARWAGDHWGWEALPSEVVS